VNTVKPKRERFSTQVDPVIQSLARAAVTGMQRTQRPDYSLAQFTEDALEKYAMDLAKKYNGGRPWTANPRALRPGRRFDDEQGEDSYWA